MSQNVNRDSADAWFARLDEKLDNLKEDVASVKIQTTKTNGRVTALEAWRNRIVGVIIFLGAVIGLVVEMKR